ncbi:rhomboid family intramembrane serine protease [Alteromonas halophila]|uniref:Rhomboid family intramembrane serine protease n=1 Tax=Alteromonas halophila TaxID=516698 RepID=A0A918JL18_9ALTE|nr:rhomboid family intramembrane serine protease [Alteromonas halophila]GGW86764.1 rhomboid family intramembrane serine protease [Alteromonas halophila]
MKAIATVKQQLSFLGIVAGILLVLEVINLFTGNYLNQYGLVPRHLHALGFMFTAPWLHSSPTHLIANLLPLVLFMWLTMQWGNKVFVKVSLTVMVLSGIGVWLFARSAVHIGASGMLYGYFGFLLLAGFTSGRVRYLLISIVVIALYGGMLVGVLPTQRFISFEYHLFGFLAGLLSAWTWARRRNTV